MTTTTTPTVPTIGTRVHYTGDMANVEGWGVCTEILLNRWGTTLTIEIEAQPCEVEEYSVPARTMKVSPSNFGTHAGCRFSCVDG